VLSYRLVARLASSFSRRIALRNRRQNTFGPKHILEPRRLAVHLNPPSDTSGLPAINSPSTYNDETELDATSDWLAHIAAGRIEVR
jgi:hypothetical protein